MSAEKKLKELGIEFPEESKPLGTYAHAMRTGNLLFLSGHGPNVAGVAKYTGKVGGDLSIEDGYAAARLTGINLLRTIRQEMGSLDKVVQVVKVVGFVNSAPGFFSQPKVVNGASDLFIEVFGTAGRHARSAVGMAELPNNIAVEVEMIVEVKD